MLEMSISIYFHKQPSQTGRGRDPVAGLRYVRIKNDINVEKNPEK